MSCTIFPQQVSCYEDSSRSYTALLSLQLLIYLVSATKKPKETREFNTSRALKSVNDSSPIDLAFFPPLYSSDPSSATHNSIQQITLLPDNFYPARASNPLLVSAEPPVIKPEVSVSSASLLSEGIVSIMSEADGGKGADGLGLAKEAKQEMGVVKEVWEGFLDDLLGERKKLA